MQEIDALKLLEKIREGKATDEEKALLDTWYLQYKANEEVGLSEEDYLIAENSLRDNLHIRYAQPKTRNLWPSMTAAASVIFFLFVGSYYYLHRHAVKAPTGVLVQNDITPGGNKATLTLANGQKILLPDVRSGQVALQGKVIINKTGQGQIVYQSAGAQQAAVGSTIAEYNTLNTPRGGQYHITLSDGTNVWLNAASSIRYPAAFAGKERRVVITGEAYFEVAHNKDMPFRVISNGQELEVLGTHFNINAYADEQNVITTLFQGSVKISCNKVTALLKPDQQSVVRNDGSTNTIRILNANANQVLAWKNGEFYFHAADVRTIMRQVSRWYDVDIQYQGEVSDDNFNGEISRNVNVSQVLRILELSGIKFKIEGRKIIVKE
jgi:transmembrane sensor